MNLNALKEQDPVIYEAVMNELERQNEGVELIASENIVSTAVLETMGTWLTNKYSEGYPDHSYYGGNEFIDVSEKEAIERAKKLFNAEHANVQPHAGSPANMAAYFSVLNVGDKINVVTLNVPGKNIEDARFDLNEKLEGAFRVKTFWHEFGSLLEAVEVEKLLIGLIFQLVVLISVFNVLAFIIFLNEKKSQEIFLLRALGLNQKKLLGIWLSIITGVWFLSCALAVLLVHFFNYLLTYVSIFKVPGEIYHMGRLKILLTSKDYILVFGLALLWLLLVFAVGYIRLRKRPILEGLRKEFA